MTEASRQVCESLPITWLQHQITAVGSRYSFKETGSPKYIMIHYIVNSGVTPYSSPWVECRHDISFRFPDHNLCMADFNIPEACLDIGLRMSEIP